MTTSAVEVADVDAGSVGGIGARSPEAKGRQVDSRITREPNGRVTAKLVYEVPLAAAASLVEQFKKAGTVREQQSVRDPAGPGREVRHRPDRRDAHERRADRRGRRRALAAGASAALSTAPRCC